MYLISKIAWLFFLPSMMAICRADIINEIELSQRKIAPTKDHGNLFSEKSVANSSKMAVCNGTQEGESLICKSNSKYSISDGSTIFSVVSSGWRLVSVSYNPESRKSYFYFSMD